MMLVDAVNAINGGLAAIGAWRLGELVLQWQRKKRDAKKRGGALIHEYSDSFSCFESAARLAKERSLGEGETQILMRIAQGISQYRTGIRGELYRAIINYFPGRTALLEACADGLATGMKNYGQLDAVNDRRDWSEELKAELRDALVYCEANNARIDSVSQ